MHRHLPLIKNILQTVPPPKGVIQQYTFLDHISPALIVFNFRLSLALSNRRDCTVPLLLRPVRARHHTDCRKWPAPVGRRWMTTSFAPHHRTLSTPRRTDWYSRFEKNSCSRRSRRTSGLRVPPAPRALRRRGSHSRTWKVGTEAAAAAAEASREEGEASPPEEVATWRNGRCCPGRRCRPASAEARRPASSKACLTRTTGYCAG